MIQNWIKNQNSQAKNPVKDATDSIRKSLSLSDIDKDDSKFIPIRYNDQQFLLARWGDNVMLWRTLNIFNQPNSTEKVYTDDAWGPCTAHQVWVHIFNQLVKNEKEYQDNIIKLCKQQEKILIGLRKRLQDTILTVKNNSQQSILTRFMRELYDIDITTDQGVHELEELKKKVSPYIETCCDKFGRLSPFAVAFVNSINNYFHEIREKIMTERAEAKTAGFTGELNVFKSVKVEEVLEFIAEAVSEANTFLSSIAVGQKGLIKLPNLQGTSFKFLSQLKSEAYDLCKGLSYVPTPKTFCTKLRDLATNERGKQRSNGSKGITVESLMETYNNIMLASVQDFVGNKYINGIKTSIYKYPPQWVIDKQNNNSEESSRKKPANNLYEQIEKEKIFDKDEDEN